MGIGSNQAVEGQEANWEAKKEAWIRAKIGDPNSDTRHRLWLHYEQEFPDLEKNSNF